MVSSSSPVKMMMMMMMMMMAAVVVAITATEAKTRATTVVGFGDQTRRLVKSNEIPRGSSKESEESTICGLSSLPAPLTLETCTEPIPEGIPDHRGNWSSTSSENSTDNHDDWQIIEQCGSRYTVSGPASSNGYYYIHDFLIADGTMENGVMDYNAFVMPECTPVTAAGIFEGNCMNMTIGGTAMATRCLMGGSLEFFNRIIGETLLLNRVGPLPYDETSSSSSSSSSEETTTSSSTTSDGDDDASSASHYHPHNNCSWKPQHLLLQLQ